MLVMVVFFIAFRWIHLSTPLIRLFLLVLILLLMPTLNFLPVWFALSLLRFRLITRTENILHRNFTRRQVAIQNRVASNIGISQSTFSVKVLNLFSRSRRKTNKRKSKHSAMLRNKETRHRMFIGLLNT